MPQILVGYEVKLACFRETYLAILRYLVECNKIFGDMEKKTVIVSVKDFCQQWIYMEASEIFKITKKTFGKYMYPSWSTSFHFCFTKTGLI